VSKVEHKVTALPWARQVWNNREISHKLP